MPDMLKMAARELRNPMALVILMVARYALFHLRYNVPTRVRGNVRLSYNSHSVIVMYTKNRSASLLISLSLLLAPVYALGEVQATPAAKPAQAAAPAPVTPAPAPASTPAATPPAQPAASLVDKINSLKTARIQSSEVVVKSPEGVVSKDGTVGPAGGIIEVSGYAAGNVDIAVYLKAVTDANIGEVKLLEIQSVGTQKQRRSHFIFQVIVAPRAATGTVATDFVRVTLDPQSPWYEHAEFFPSGRTVHGMPIEKIDARWCAANEFTREMFPPAVYGDEALGLDATLRAGGTFSLSGKLDGVGQVTIVVGAYKTCDEKTGTFVLALNDDTPASPVLHLEQHPKAYFAYLSGDVQNFWLWDCFACDGAASVAWNGANYGGGVKLKGNACIRADVTVYARQDEHSRALHKTTTAEHIVVLDEGNREGNFFWHRIQTKDGTIGFVLNRDFHEGC